MCNSVKPLISILMLTYNHSHFVKQAIDSVLSQDTEYNFELIICDDASTDGTQNIVKDYAAKDSRVILSLQPVNTNLGKNFADGCNLVRGKYVAFCEGDDYWTTPGKLQKQVSFLENHPDFTVCSHRVQMLFDNAQPDTKTQYIYKDCTADEERIRNGIFYADEAIANYYFHTGSLVLRWRFTDGLPHWFRKRMMLDHFLLMLHAVEGKIKYFDEVMSIWRRHGTGYSWLQTQDKGLFFQKQGRDWIAVYNNMDKFFHGRFHWQIQERICLALRSMAQNCMETGNIEQLKSLIDANTEQFEHVVCNAVMLDAVRLVYPNRPEFSPPWESSKAVHEANVEREKDDTNIAVNLQTQDNNERFLGGPFPLALDDIPIQEGNVWDAWIDGKEYARFYNLRSALMSWLWEHGVSTIWLPSYCPPILENNRFACQFTRKFYSVGATLEPDISWLEAVQPGEAVIAISYLGRPLPDSLCQALSARKDILWVEDRAQSLRTGQKSLAHAVIYSPRKLFGVPDGGILVGKKARFLEKRLLNADHATQMEKKQILLQRLEQTTMDPRNLVLDQAGHEMRHQLSRSRMSRSTELLLKRIPLAKVAQKRKENWQVLYERLGKHCLWPIACPDFAPFAFPLVLPINYPTEAMHTLLTRQRILCQRLWCPLPIQNNTYPLEQALAQRLLLLPCDQRFGKDEMSSIAEAVLRIMKDPCQASSKSTSF